jgi:hypothetical protein
LLRLLFAILAHSRFTEETAAHCGVNITFPVASMRTA